MIKRLLIANRGEIAQRIICACRALNIEVGVIFSQEDSDSLAVKNADEAYLLDSRDNTNVYLDINQIITIAIERSYDAIHPGYGFLSENSEFVQECEKNNIIFIGPDSKTVELASHKNLTKKIAKKCGIPIIKEFKPNELKKADYPLLLKNTVGGGGRGIRVLNDKKDFKRLHELVKRESNQTCGRQKVLVEKFIPNARHIEIQILADKFGKIIHLFERECSVQRRNQKIVEEAPSTSIQEEIKRKLRKYAKALAREINYVNAGTFEFLVSQDNHIFFLEVNPRIQVEHTVTEEITGIDIVKEQITIAEGKHLSFKQSEVKSKGHAMECRITTENVMNNLSPTTGKIVQCIFPMGKDIRIDGDVFAGKTIYSNYDSLLFKLIVWAENRQNVISRMRQILEEIEIIGVSTNLCLLKAILSNSDFHNNQVFTNFLKRQQILEKAQEFEEAKRNCDEIDFRELESRKIALIAASIYQKMEGELSSKTTLWTQKARMVHN